MTHVPGPGGPPPGPVTYEAPVTIKRMLFATWALLDSLRPDLKAAALVPDMRAPGGSTGTSSPNPTAPAFRCTRSTGTRRSSRNRCSRPASACAATVRRSP